MRSVMRSTFLSGLSLTLFVGGSPAAASVTVFTDQVAFNSAISSSTTYTPVQNASGVKSYTFGPVTETVAGFLTTYTGDYGPGVRSVGAFLSPVSFSSSQNALGLTLGYYIGPQTATYTIDGVSGTITVPDNSANPNSIFIGFTDTSPISLTFQTDGAEFDTLRVISGSISAAPEPATWAFLAAGVCAIGWVLRRKRRNQPLLTSQE